MHFDYKTAELKHLLEHYDGIPLIQVMTYKGKDYLMYAIDWNTDNCFYEYMVTSLSLEASYYVQKRGVLGYLQKQLASGELYHLKTGMWNDSEADELRLLTEEEAIEVFPKEEFQLDFSA